MDFLITFGSTFFGLFVLFPIIFGFARLFGVYAIVEEGTCHIYVLFGKVRAVLDASLITGIDPPPEVESALAAINTAHNSVSSDISLAQAHADQKIVQSRRAVEIETLNAHAEVEPLTALAETLSTLKASGPAALESYRRNVRLKLFSQAAQVVLEDK